MRRIQQTNFEARRRHLRKFLEGCSMEQDRENMATDALTPLKQKIYGKWPSIFYLTFHSFLPLTHNFYNGMILKQLCHMCDNWFPRHGNQKCREFMHQPYTLRHDVGGKIKSPRKFCHFYKSPEWIAEEFIKRPTKTFRNNFLFDWCEESWGKYKNGQENSV